jgi:hypothetical protein
MRHIPEEELHAYLDQALSRSQCVEIESHLAGCPSCQSLRDGIAALRDRTTALLAKLAPPRGFPPPFESLRNRAAVAANQHRRRVQVLAWAASVVLAVGLGWTANYLTIGHRTIAPAVAAHPVPTPAAPAITTPPLPVTPAAVRQPSHPARSRTRRVAVKPAADSTPVVALAPVVPAPVLELTSVDMPHSEPEELDGMWRTMSWDGAQAATGDQLPHIDGLPVVQVQVQSSEHGKQPLMVVAQQLASGEVIRTIEGPMSDVSHLLANRAMTDPDPSIERPGDSSKATNALSHTDRTMAMQRGDRMLAITGALPSDSLLAMIRRLNAEMRSK